MAKCGNLWIRERLKRLRLWQNGWSLTNNPDGTITANPKYTMGLPSETLVRVPIGLSTPSTSPSSAGGGVVVAYSTENEDSDIQTEDLGPGGEEPAYGNQVR